MKRRAFVAAGVALAATAARAQEATRIGVFDGPGIGPEALAAALACIEASGMHPVVMPPGAFVAAEVSRLDALLFTGGRGSLQGRALGERGREAVRAAVREGTGYVGICGGAFLALQGEPEFHKLGMVAARHGTGDAWMRGIGPALVRPEDGCAAVTLHYANGPLISAEPVEGLSPPIPLAHFETEYALPEHDTHPGEMMGAPAVVSARFGAGGIVLFSPNPNLRPAHDELLIAALRSVARRGHPLDTWAAVFG